MSVALIRFTSLFKRHITYHANVDSALMSFADERMKGSQVNTIVIYEVHKDDPHRYGKKLVDLSISSKTKRAEY